MDWGKILIGLIKTSPQNKRRKKYYPRKKNKLPTAQSNRTLCTIANFSQEERIDLFLKATYKNSTWWKLFILTSRPNIKELAKKLGISYKKLVKEYKSYKQRK